VPETVGTNNFKKNHFSMFADFLLDVLLLRQGRKVSETAMHLHGFCGNSCKNLFIDNWETFIKSSVSPGDYIFSSDVRQLMLESLDNQLNIMSKIKPPLKEDVFNYELTQRHETMLTSARKWLSNAFLGMGENNDRFLRLWYFIQFT
jgi:hypothetical protein